MPRVGHNPNRDNKRIPRPHVSAGVVTHYTDDAYHAERLPIVRACLASIVAAHPDELIIWDNGSTPDFRAMLAEFSPSVLVLSDNVGLNTAKHQLFNIARGEIFHYSDDDVLHDAGWLDAEMEILKTYPSVGTVSGSPMRVHFRWGNNTNMEQAGRHKMTVNYGRLIPAEYERDYCASIGCNCGKHEEAYKGLDDVLLTYQGVKAWAHGHHFEFTCRRETMKPYFKPSDFMMNSERQRDEEIDAAGFMRLTTYKRVTRHMGNKYALV